MLLAMQPTMLQWAVKTAVAAFELDFDLLFCHRVVDHISLPPFFAPEDDDLAWIITVEFQPTRPPIVSGRFDGQWISFNLSFKSSSGKAKVPVRRIVDISQSVDQDVITNLCIKYPGVLKEECFSSHTNVVPVNIDACGLHLGSVYVCNTFMNKLKIYVKLTVNCETLTVENPPPIPPSQVSKNSQENSLRALSISFDGLLQSGLMSDVTLSVDGHELQAHRLILAARSDVFKAMFASECRESASGIVKIEDIRLPVFKEFLRFIYSGSLSAPARPSGAAEAASQRAAGEGVEAVGRDGQQAADEDDYLMELLVAADKYLVEDLKEVCQGRLLDCLSAKVDSASLKTLCDVLRAGHHLGSAPLREVGITYLRLHRAAVLASPEWKDFTATSRRVAADAMLDSHMLPAGENP